MNHDEKLKAIQFIRPGAEFVLRGDELQWLDKIQIEPTETEIETGRIAYQEAEVQAKAEAQAQKQAILDRLGLTEEELRIVLG